jgi:hypothetical protein
MKEKVSELAVTISRETFDKMEGFSRKLDRLPNPLILYAGLGIVAVLVVIALVNILSSPSDISALQADISAIKQALGIP